MAEHDEARGKHDEAQAIEGYGCICFALARGKNKPARYSIENAFYAYQVIPLGCL